VTMVFNPEEIQGNILRSYRRNMVRHMMLEVSDLDTARRFMAASADGTSGEVPAITRSAMWVEKPEVCFNIGVTFEGLRAMRTPASHLASFPMEYAEGMAKRAAKLGDIGDSAPENWPAPFDQPERLHMVASIHADEEDHLNAVETQVNKAFTVLGVRNGRGLPDGKVFFGYVDGISQPKFQHIFDPAQVGVNEPLDPLGTVLLGHPTHFEGLKFNIPTPDELGLNGAFNAFRVLAQDAAGFEDYLDEAASKLIKHPKVDLLLAPGDEKRVGENLNRIGALREVVAAQMCGRWRNGVPYELSPDAQWPDEPVSLTNYDYTRESRCPAGAHMRRVNPRGGPIVQRVANYSRRLVRRGMSYGPDFDPASRDNEERGLLGNFIGANYGAQFEAVVCDWLNLGLQDPEITGTNDPLLGANVPETSAFELTLSDGGRIRLSGFPRFVKTRGGAYTFLPSLPAIRYLSQLTD
jgi:deferrochelatase/peroxidase EfeB